MAALLEIGAGFHPDYTAIENIFLCGAIYGVPRKELETAGRRHHRLRRARALRRQPGQDVLVRHVHPARLRDRGQRRPRHPADRRGAGRRRPLLPGPLHGPHAGVPRRRQDADPGDPRPGRRRDVLRAGDLARRRPHPRRRRAARGRAQLHRRGHAGRRPRARCRQLQAAGIAPATHEPANEKTELRLPAHDLPGRRRERARRVPQRRADAGADPLPRPRSRCPRRCSSSRSTGTAARRSASPRPGWPITPRTSPSATATSSGGSTSSC